MLKNNRGLVIVGLAVLIIVSCVCLPSGFVASSLATPTPKPSVVLVIGKSYWVNMNTSPEGATTYTTPSLYDRPSSIFTNSATKIVQYLSEDTELVLIGWKSNWCYVRANVYPDDEYSHSNQLETFEGWIECVRLLDVKPIPYPTPNMTPQSP